MRDHFDAFELVYDERFQSQYGFWQPVIRTAIDKFLKCVDLRKGFARVRCADCGKEFFVAFSCRQRCCCPSCDQKRALLLGMRLVSYISRCPFSLARMIRVTDDGEVIYRAGKSECVRFPQPGDERLREGVSRNFQVFDAMEFLAEVTQHIPDKGQHLIHYFGRYSNKERGLRKKREASSQTKAGGENAEADAFIKQRRMSWAAMIKKVYEVDPLRCPDCGGEMNVISFIDKCQAGVVEKIVRHCGLWKETVPRPPPQERKVAEGESDYDCGYFERVCI